MFTIPKEDLKDQAGLERALRSYFDYIRTDEGKETFNYLLDPQLESCDYAARTMVISMTPKPWMKNPAQMIHGGVTASIVDFTMGILCRCCSTGLMTPTIDMSVSYLRPAPIDKRLFVKATVTMRGFTVCHATAVAWAEGNEDRPVVSASGSYYVTHRPDEERKKN